MKIKIASTSSASRYSTAVTKSMPTPEEKRSLFADKGFGFEPQRQNFEPLTAQASKSFYINHTT